MMFPVGTGMTRLSNGFLPSFAMYWYRGIPLAAAPARQTVIETARITLALNLDLHQPHVFLGQWRTSTMSL